MIYQVGAFILSCGPFSVMLARDAGIPVTQHRDTAALGELWEFDRAVTITVHCFLRQRFLLPLYTGKIGTLLFCAKSFLQCSCECKRCKALVMPLFCFCFFANFCLHFLGISCCYWILNTCAGKILQVPCHILALLCCHVRAYFYPSLESLPMRGKLSTKIISYVDLNFE